MAEATEAAPAAAAAVKGSGRKKLILIASAALAAVLLLGGGGAWWFGLFGKSATAAAGGGEPAAMTADAHGAAGGEAGKASAVPGVAFVDLPDVVVNLQTSGQRQRFLKLRMSLEVAGDHEADQVRLLTPRVMDSFQLYLRALTVDDVQGAVGMQRLKEEMLARVDHAVEPLKIADVLIREMLVQ